MKGKAWRTRNENPRTTRQTLKINRDYALSVIFDHSEADPNCAAPLSAKMELEFLPMRQVVMRGSVMFGHEDWPPAERGIRSRRQAISLARQWQHQVQRTIRKLRLPLKDASPDAEKI